MINHAIIDQMIFKSPSKNGVEDKMLDLRLKIKKKFSYACNRGKFHSPGVTNVGLCGNPLR